ncbi:MAG: STAS domain-containing protein [Deltaproteobacteria bacterium]|nr:STAS domain-containing protein [Deltaproteobacteria bacterium]
MKKTSGLVFWALRESLRKGYGTSHFLHDLKSGLIVGLVAIPLGMALSVAINLPPQHGLYTCIIGGIICALLGGSKFQVTGPTAAFVVILVPIVQRFGIEGLFLAGFLSGFLLILFSIFRLGKVIEFLPHPVVTGFTAGIAVVIFTLQIKDFMGLPIPSMPHYYWERVIRLAEYSPLLNVAEFLVGFFTLVVIFLCNRYLKKTPGPIIGLTLATLLVEGLKWWNPNLQVATIANRFSTQVGDTLIAGIPSGPPLLRLDWLFPGGQFVSMDLITHIFPAALTIALLGAIESLLSAVVADGMTRTRHEPNAELLAQGIGNMLCPFAGGIPATGAIARTATNIRFGAKSPLSTVVHGLFILLAMLYMAPFISLVPMASLAALLMIVAYNMSEIKHVKSILQLGSADDKLVFLCCFLLTIFIDMTAGVLTGFGLATLLFMKRMVSLTSGGIALEKGGKRSYPTLPPRYQIYHVSGPMFFGAAHKAMSSLGQVSKDLEVLILDLTDVAMLDITGLTALRSGVLQLSEHGIQITIVVSSHELERHVKRFLHLTAASNITVSMGPISQILKREAVSIPI